MHTYTIYVGQSAPKQVARVLDDLTIGALDTVRGYWQGKGEDTTRVSLALTDDVQARIVAARLAHHFQQDCVLVVRSEHARDSQAMHSMRAYRTKCIPADRTEDAYTVTTSGYAYRYATNDDSRLMHFVAFTVDSLGGIASIA